MAAIMIVAPTALLDESFVRRAGEGTALTAPFTDSVIKVRGEDTGGKFALIEWTIPARSAGPPLHIHMQGDELLYVLEGALLLQLGTRRIRAAAGAVCHIPKGSAHTFCNPYDAPARTLGILAPAGLERYFEEYAALWPTGSVGQSFDPGRMTALDARYGSIAVGPPLSPDSTPDAAQCSGLLTPPE